MSERLAVLDVGSNAVRFVLARVTPGVEFRVLRHERVQTWLAGSRPSLKRISAPSTSIARPLSPMTDAERDGYRDLFSRVTLVEVTGRTDFPALVKVVDGLLAGR